MATKPPPDAQTSWQPARLIPVVGIRGQEEQERRATSALLAVMGAVPEFGRALLRDVGAPKGRISTFTEIQLKDADGKVSIPDGAIVVEWGKTRWQALVEVKTGSASLGAEQVGRYLDMAKEHGFAAVLTISNAITANASDIPFSVDRRKTRRVDLFHLSWWRIITDAVFQHRFRGVSDPDQQWILGELLAYLEHENSGASGFEDMGESWVKARDGARHGTLRPSDAEVRAVCERWAQLIDYLSLGLSQELGREVAPVRPRAQTSAERLDGLVQGLAGNGTLADGLRVPDAVGILGLCANLHAQQLTTSVALDAPKKGGPQTRINWLLRQLAAAPPEVTVEVSFAGIRETSALLLREAREYPHRLLCASDPKREPRSFSLAMTRKMGLQRGRGAGSFVRETRNQMLAFYGEVVQGLKPWQPSAPKLPIDSDVVGPPEAVPAGPVEPGEGVAQGASSSDQLPQSISSPYPLLLNRGPTADPTRKAWLDQG